MADATHIEWADSTFNPWEGCQKVGPGCDYCYAEARNVRFNGRAINWGPHAVRRRTSASNWNKPRRWQREAAAFFVAHGRRRRVFCASLADVFDNAVNPAWRADLFDLIRDTPDLDWLLLTKRIGNAAAMLPADWGKGWPHVWLGATVVNQAEADRDVPKLLSTPAAVRFLSCEPLLGAIDLSAIQRRQAEGFMRPLDGRFNCLDWIIAGGESGPGARPMHPDWVRSLRDQCAAAGVPFLFKQWGEHLEHETACDILGDDDPRLSDGQRRRGGAAGLCVVGGATFVKVGKKAAGRTLDGAEHLEWPVSPVGRVPA